ncbi:distal tail protein Dit [Jeotgalibaca dankookensis]|uniref:distal tail protein Dit n=1 Tax=Jeotgalibaca dankookensis TaxID=708126 RepID=UPI0007857893|nr:distal tail protein Dit [Jeotgalibaca dankookensis]
MTRSQTALFNDQKLTDVITITALYKGINLGRVSKTRTRNGSRGVDFLGYSSEIPIFSMEFVFKSDIENASDKLAQMLNVTEPKELWFSSKPNIIYNAFPRGNISIDEKSPFGDGVIEWEIPDGVAYKKGLDNGYDNNETKDYILINNPGTENIELRMEAYFKGDSGFLGLSGPLTNVLIGDLKEVDGVDYKRSERLFDDAMFQDRSWVANAGVVPKVTSNPRQAGTMSYKKETATEGYAHPTYYGPVVGDWSGPSITKIVPTDTEGIYPTSWKSDFRLDFNTDGGVKQKEQVGHSSMSYIDQNDKIIVSIVIEDNFGYAERSDFAVYVRDKRVFDSRNTTSYYFTARPGQGNQISVSLMDGKVKVQLTKDSRDKKRRKTQVLDFPFKEKNVFLRKVTWYAARYKGHAPIQNNLLRAINLTKYNVVKWRDLPNKFMKGDLLEYGRDNYTFYCILNGQNELRLRDLGSTTILAPPGQSIINILHSGFSEVPQVLLSGRVRYLI